MKLAEIVEASSRLSGTRSRLEKMEVLGEILRRATEEEIPLVVSCLSGRLPRGKIGIGYATLSELRGLSGASASTLAIGDVDRLFDEIERVSGSGSSAARGEILRDLFRRATKDEQDFLGRLLIEDLRQGSLEGVMLEAVARASEISPERVRRAFMLSGDLGLVAKLALHEPDALPEIQIELFRPVRPMLAQTCEDAASALEILETAGFEYKLDGARIQVHKRGPDVRIFSRQSNDVTGACPEVAEAVARVPANEMILDGEAIAFDAKGRPHTFQTTMRRFGRKLDVAAMRQALPLAAVFFDCLYLEGEALIDRPARERFESLRTVLPEALVVPRLVTSGPDEARCFVERALEAGHEGVMAKSLDAPYEAGSRGKSWLKIKTAETLDLVVLAAEWGSGRRQGWLSNLHLGARDPESGEYVMLGKTFKGMTDEILSWQTKRLQEIEVRRDDWAVYVRPELVVEIAFNDIQKSRTYEGGLALRFARLKAYREDKTAEEADTIGAVREIYRRKTGDAAGSSARQLDLFRSGSDL
jgi:DNA ligase-1